MTMSEGKKRAGELERERDEAVAWFENHMTDEDGEPMGLNLAGMFRYVFDWGDGAWHHAGLSEQRANELERENDKLAARAIQLERKADLYDRALAVVKTEGNTRAYYVLRAESAEARASELERTLERIAWHELTWEEARDVARAALDKETP